MFGDLETRKGFDMLLRLAASQPDTVCVRFGRTKTSYSSNLDTIQNKEKLLFENRIFELDMFVESRDLIDFIFTTVNFIILPYKRYFRSSGVLIDVLRRGLPVMTSQNGVMGYVVKKYGVGRVFKDGNSKSLEMEYLKFKENLHVYKNNIKWFKKDYSKTNIDKIMKTMLS